ncbi:hypothetical protein ACSLPA_33320, partial [Escherichia coli]
IVVHGHRDSIFKENTIQQCTCTVSIILAISIKALARALSFSENGYGLAGLGMGKVKSINQYRLTPGFGGFVSVPYVTTECRLT